MYRGGEGMWAWILHRVSGVLVTIFLLFHILDTFLLGWPEIYDWLMRLYSHPVFHTGEVVLVAAVLYHAINGTRIMVMEFWPPLTSRHKQFFYIQTALFFILFIPSAIVMLFGRH